MKIQQPLQALPGTFVDSSLGHPSTETTGGIDIANNDVAGAWQTIEVADWPALDDVPLAANWIEVKFEPYTRSITAAICFITVNARRAGSSAPAATVDRVAHLEFVGDNTQRHLNQNVHKIPLNPSAGVVQVELQWVGANYTLAQTTINCFILGYGFNP